MIFIFINVTKNFYINTCEATVTMQTFSDQQKLPYYTISLPRKSKSTPTQRPSDTRQNSRDAPKFLVSLAKPSHICARGEEKKICARFYLTRAARDMTQSEREIDDLIIAREGSGAAVLSIAI